MTAYYNENDPYAAAWLAALIREGLIPDGHIDNRSVLDVPASDLDGFTQVHLFAGIGGWPYAFRLAGWPDDRPAWSGSCPCQPFSGAGHQRGHADERHLWPAFHTLIAECSPAVVFGEQVASSLGREWLAGIRADLEHLGYACGAADLPAASVEAPHSRQRLYWVGNAVGARLEELRLGSDELPHPTRRQIEDGHPRCAGVGRPWRSAGAVRLDDGSTRRAEPSAFPLAYGIPGRMGRLRAYGNAIVPQVAAEFIRAWMETV